MNDLLPLAFPLSCLIVSVACFFLMYRSRDYAKGFLRFISIYAVFYAVIVGGGGYFLSTRLEIAHDWLTIVIIASIPMNVAIFKGIERWYKRHGY